MPFYSLPLEVVQIILEACADDRYSLLSLSLVDQSFNRETEAILYRVVSFRRQTFSLATFLTSISSSHQRADHVRTLDIIIDPKADYNIYCFFSWTLPCMSNLKKLSFRSEVVSRKPIMAEWLFEYLPPSLVSLDIGLDCGPILWGLLRSLHNLGHLVTLNSRSDHVCQFPNDVVPELSSFEGCLSCVARVLSDRRVSTLTVTTNNVDIGSLSNCMKDSIRSWLEITSLEFLSVVEDGDMFLPMVAERCPSLRKLSIGFLWGKKDQILEKLMKWGSTFRQSQSLRRIAIAMQSIGVTHGSAGLTITSWVEECPHLSDVFLFIHSSGGYEEAYYHRDQSNQPGVLTTGSQTFPLLFSNAEEEKDFWRSLFD